MLASEIIGQDSIHVVRRYENDKPVTTVDSAFYSIRNTIFVSLDEGFDDSIYVAVNDVPLVNAYLKTNLSIGLAGGFAIDFNDSSEIKNLKILFVKAHRIIYEKINLGYKSLQVRGLNPWQLVYTNRTPMRE